MSKNVRAANVLGAGRRLAFELLIVFLGVYAAFQVDNYREELAGRERSRDLARTIQRGLDNAIETESKFVEDSIAGLSEWQSAWERGESPSPFVLRISGSEQAPWTVYEAIIQSRPAELFDTDLVFDLGYFYSELLGVGDRYVRYAEFTERNVLPNLKVGAAAFYDSEGKILRPEYEAHMDRLRELVEMWSADVQRARELKKRFDSFVD